MLTRSISCEGTLIRSPASNRLRTGSCRGFTLVELLIVVIILSILAAIVMPQFTSATEDAKLSTLDNSLANMRSIIDFFYQQHGFYPSGVTSAGGACAAGPGGTGGTGAIDSAVAFREQLTLYTDMAGVACTKADADFRFGPYLKKATIAQNPYTNTATIVVVTTGTLSLVAAGTTGGWRFDNKSGKFIADHTSYDDR